MAAHLLFLANLNFLRAAGGLALGTVLLYFSDRQRVDPFRRTRMLESDETAFLVIGIILVSVALVRGFQALHSLVELWRIHGSRGTGAIHEKDQAVIRPWSLRISLSVVTAGLFWVFRAIFALLARRGRRRREERGIRAGSTRTEGLTATRLSRFCRRLGLGLAVFDLVDLTLFPITTACGLYGFLVHRNPDTMDFYEGKFNPGR